MQIESPEDIDLAKVVRTLPYGPHKLRAFMIRGDVTVTSSRDYVAAVRLTKRGPQFYYSKPLFEEYVEDYIDVAFVTFHELLHVLEGHLDLDGVRSRFQEPNLFEGIDSINELEDVNEKDIDPDDKRKYKIIHYVNELEIKHLEHLLLEDDKFHKLNEKLYGGEGQDRNTIMYRGADDIDSPVYKAIHKRIFSQGNFSPIETFRVLSRQQKDEFDQKPMPDESDGSGQDQDSEQESQSRDSGDQGEMSSEGQPQPGDSEDEDGDGDSQGGNQEEGEEEESEEGEGNGDGEEEDQSGDQSSGSEEQDGEGEKEGEDNNEEGKEEGESEEKDGEGEEEKDEEGEDGEKEDESGGGDPMQHENSGIDEDAREEDVAALQEAMEQIVDKAEDGDGYSEEMIQNKRDDRKRPVVQQPKNKEVEKAIQDTRSAPSFHSKLGEILHDRVGDAIHRSVVPNYTDDHRARINRKLGRDTLKYRHEDRATQERVAFYYDCSSSQDQYIPACNEIVTRYKQYFADQKVFVFGSHVEEVSANKFTRHAQQGTVTGLLRARGTSFNNVLHHADENNFKEIVILTDDEANISEHLIEPLREQNKLEYILVILTNSENPDNMGFISQGYADEVIELELNN